MQGPREIAVALAQVIMIGPNPLPFQLNGMPAAYAAELVDAGVEIEKIALPDGWLEQSKLSIVDPEFREMLVGSDEDDCQICIYRVDKRVM